MMFYEELDLKWNFKEALQKFHLSKIRTWLHYANLVNDLSLKIQSDLCKNTKFSEEKAECPYKFASYGAFLFYLLQESSLIPEDTFGVKDDPLVGNSSEEQVQMLKLKIFQGLTLVLFSVSKQYMWERYLKFSNTQDEIIHSAFNCASSGGHFKLATCLTVSFFVIHLHTLALILTQTVRGRFASWK